ncbi:glycosyltransferase family protein [Fulvivirga lutea]|uniref:Glycosyl transferase n=1 Tax=Fulvivirga lutea TaxID=2810512 RepID=A0A974WFI3_9BACT|nr:glycosyltransferase family protein [Fulvivirga lutea]QSE96563.1 glycosyl transferase [Fulvivirga lutea]
MKILYAIQGTGNGHMSRAMDVAPALEKHGQVDYMVSGAQADIALPYSIKYKSKGLSFFFGKKGGIDIGRTFNENSSRRIWKEVHDLPIEQYDLIINDFEPISAWAAKLKGKKVIALSHQSALLSSKCPKPKSLDIVGQSILKNYAPATKHYGFHFNSFDENIYTPIVRNSIRQKELTKNGHYTVYLPAYSDEKIIKILSQVKGVDWKVFSKHTKSKHWHENVSIEPINNERFVNSLTSSIGVLCGAGFETPSEALFLQKKLMVIPMKGQYEQQCNAEALKEMGIPIAKKLGKKSIEKIQNWIDTDQHIEVNYQDETQAIVDKIVANEL